MAGTLHLYMVFRKELKFKYKTIKDPITRIKNLGNIMLSKKESENTNDTNIPMATGECSRFIDFFTLLL